MPDQAVAEAPASAPVAAPAAAPAAAPLPMMDAFDQLDKWAKPPSTEPAAPQPTQRDKANAKFKVAPDEVAKPAAEVPKAPEAPEAKPAETPAAKVKKPADFMREKMEKLEKEVNEWKAKATQPQEDPEKKTLSERLAEREKKLADYESEMRFKDYSKSAEYKEKYEQPFFNAYGDGQKRATALKVNDLETGEVRAGTAADFDALMRIEDDAAAGEFAENIFGKAASSVLYQRNKIVELASASKNALAEYRAKGSEREKQMQEQQLERSKKLGATWNELNKQAAEIYPQYFKPVEGDKEHNDLLEKGYQLADSAFAGNLPPEEAVKVHSAVRNRAAAFGPLTRQLSNAQSRIAELTKELEAFKASEPTAGEGSKAAGSAAPKGDSMDSILDGLDRISRPGR